MRDRNFPVIRRLAGSAAVWLLFAALTAPAAEAAPVTTAPFGDDLDGDGQVEVEGTTMRQSFAAVRGEGSSAVVSFSFMFLTSEASARPNVHDLFRIRLRRADANSPTNNTFTGEPAQVDGAVVRPGDSYGGSFAAYDFSNGTVDGDAASANNVPLMIPAGGIGLDTQTVLNDGGIGWQHVQFRYAATSANLVLEFLVADSHDQHHDSALLIADVAHESLSAWPASIGNGQFTDGGGNGSSSSWSLDGNYGVYDALAAANGDLITAPEGDHFMALSTSGGPGEIDTAFIPEPGSGLLLLGVGAAATLRRRPRGLRPV